MALQSKSSTCPRTDRKSILDHEWLLTMILLVVAIGFVALLGPFLFKFGAGLRPRLGETAMKALLLSFVLAVIGSLIAGPWYFVQRHLEALYVDYERFKPDFMPPDARRASWLHPRSNPLILNFLAGRAPGEPNTIIERKLWLSRRINLYRAIQTFFIILMVGGLADIFYFAAILRAIIQRAHVL